MDNESYEQVLLQQALLQAADYSDNFTKVVEELRLKLSQASGIMLFYRNGDMNYSSAQTIYLWLDKDYKPINERRDATHKIIIFVSSRGKFFAIRCQTRDAILLRHWASTSNVETDQSLQSYIEKIDRILQADGYISLPKAVLSQLAEGHKTRLDGFPATVFQVLFSELV